MITLNKEKVRFELQEILDEAVANGEESDCQLVIFQDGELIVDLTTSGITSLTLFPVFSVGKALAATACHRMVEKGVIDYDTPLAKVWSEFGCRGKDAILLRHVLAHQAGLAAIPEDIPFSMYGDWNAMCRLMAGMTPATTPGTVCRYHAVTCAWLLGETLARAAGKPFKEIIQEEVFEPAGITDFYFGTDAAADARTAELTPQEPCWTVNFIGTPEVRRGFIPSANGVGNAMSIARHYNALLQGVLLKESTIDVVTVPSRAASDPLLSDSWANFGLGYALTGPSNNPGERFGHGGAVGAEGFADRKNRIALGFTKNKINPRHPVHAVRDRISAVLGYPPRHW